MIFRNSRARLERDEKIAKLHKMGMKPAVIAERFGLSVYRTKQIITDTRVEPVNRKNREAR